MPFCARLIPLNLCVRSIESCKIMSLDVIFNYERLKYAEDPPKTVHSVNSDYGSLVEVFHIIVFIVHNCSFFFLLVFFFFFFCNFFRNLLVDMCRFTIQVVSKSQQNMAASPGHSLDLRLKFFVPSALINYAGDFNHEQIVKP